MHLADMLDRNAGWARHMAEQEPEYFKHLGELQAPELLWIGCSECRMPANVLAGLQPGEVFVHRNIGNIVSAADLNCMSTLQYAVEVLKVNRIVVCGHYGCGGVRAAMNGGGKGLAGYWLEPVKQLAVRYQRHLAGLPDDGARADFLCEENVRVQVANVLSAPVVVHARERGQNIAVHGLIYGLKDGLLRNLDCGTSEV